MKTYAISELAAADCTSASIEYNTAGADVLTLSELAPAWVEKLGWERWDKVMLTNDDGVPLFIGTVIEGREMAAQGGSAPRATFTAQSDFGILEKTTYTAVNSNGVPVLPVPFVSSSSTSPTANMQDVLSACFSAANQNYLTSTLSCELEGQTIPLGQTGATSCAQLMLSALEWAPDAVIRMGYADAAADGSGLVMSVDESADLAPVTITASGQILQDASSVGSHAGIGDISLRPRHDLVLPAAALIGAQHFSIGGEANEPGAFVYCVTRANTGSSEDTDDPDTPSDSYPAYTAPDEKKTIITGIPIPPRTTRNGGNYMDLQNSDKTTHEALAFCFPILAKIGQGNYRAGAPLLSVTPLYDLRPNASSSSGGDMDEGAPANYDTVFIANDAYIHTDGVFPASARSSRNISGLKWCKAELRLVVAVDSLPNQLTRDEAESFFKGKKKDKNGKAWRYADLTIQCTLINSSRRIVKGTQPLIGDEAYTPDTPDTPEDDSSGVAEPDYQALIEAYYNASQTLCHEGSISLLSPSVHPGAMLGRGVRVQGMHPDWENMTAICRAVSFDIATRRMTLSLGSRDVLGWDMMLERSRMSQERFLNQSEREQLKDSWAPNSGASNEDAEKESDELMVSPSINASVATTCTGRPHLPFELYQKLSDDGSTTGVWVMQGGSVWVGKTRVEIPTTETQIIDGQSGAALGDPKTNGRLKRRVYKKTSTGGGEEWTFDITQE